MSVRAGLTFYLRNFFTFGNIHTAHSESNNDTIKSIFGTIVRTVTIYYSGRREVTTRNYVNSSLRRDGWLGWQPSVPHASGARHRCDEESGLVVEH